MGCCHTGEGGGVMGLGFFEEKTVLLFIAQISSGDRDSRNIVPVLVKQCS
jgi:hypothetical protein